MPLEVAYLAEIGNFKHLATLFDLAERLQGDLGTLTMVYNERPQDLQRYMNEAMLNSKALIHHLVSRFDDPLSTKQ